MMNCQSDDCTSSSSRAACASDSWAAGSSIAERAIVQNRSSSFQILGHIHAVCEFNHMV
jgi:hypothetical protein